MPNLSSTRTAFLVANARANGASMFGLNTLNTAIYDAPQAGMWIRAAAAALASASRLRATERN